MKSPLDSGEFLQFDEVESTQVVASEFLKRNRDGDVPGVVFSKHQTAGKGRFGREWHSRPGDSLTMSLIMRDHAGHERPWLVGMAIAIAAANALKCSVRWPNDLVFEGRKVGGILTELVTAENGDVVPVVGLGINVNHLAMPEAIQAFATSIRIETGRAYDVRMVAKTILNRLPEIPEPTNWADVHDAWARVDATPGKRFRLVDGREALALHVGGEGELICDVDGETTSVMAADAIFG